MSYYGPPGGGPPQDPYGQPGGGTPNPYGQPGGYGGSQDPYGAQPADPYGAQPSGPPSGPPYGNDPYGQPASGAGYGDPYAPPAAPSYGADPYGNQTQAFGGGGYGPPPAPPKKGMSGGAIAGIVIGVVVLFALLCGGGVFLLAQSGDDTTIADGTPTPSAGDSSEVSPSDEPTPDESETNSGVSNVQNVQTGDCVKDNPDDSNSLLPSSCADTGSYIVVKRYDQTTDGTKCKSTGADTSYYWDHYTDDSKDFVLCLKSNG